MAVISWISHSLFVVLTPADSLAQALTMWINLFTSQLTVVCHPGSILLVPSSKSIAVIVPGVVSKVSCFGAENFLEQASLNLRKSPARIQLQAQSVVF